jgi:hypothetical protein
MRRRGPRGQRGVNQSARGEPASASKRAGDAEPTGLVKGVVTGVTNLETCVTCGGTGWKELDIPRGFVARCQCQTTNRKE